MSRKYVKDYRLDYVETKSGGLKAVAVYRGVYYCLAVEDETLKRLRIKLAAAAGLSLLFVVLMLFHTQLLDRDFRPVAIPLGACLLPTVLIAMSVYNLCTVQPPFTRAQRDRICNRLPISSLFQLIFGALCLGGLIAQLAVKGFRFDWLLLALGALGITVLAWLLMRGAKHILVEQITPREEDQAPALPADPSAEASD